MNVPLKNDIEIIYEENVMGKPNQTKNNTKENRDNVKPFREEDIPKIINYLADRIRYCRKHEELIRRRDFALFIMGINIGLRVSDLISLKWRDIFDETWEFREGIKYKPKKQQRLNDDGTKRVKIILLKYNDAFKKAVLDYKKYCNPTDLDSYLFPSRERRNEHICDEVVRHLITEVIAKPLNIKYNVNAHSLRKTFARVRYDHAEDKEATLILLMELFGYSDLDATSDIYV